MSTIITLSSRAVIASLDLQDSIPIVDSSEISTDRAKRFTVEQLAHFIQDQIDSRITISNVEPFGGVDGDIWFKVI